jgi:muramoyltetrapeptide carboxypeptidase
MSPSQRPGPEILLAPKLQAGDRVRLVSPASFPDRDGLEEAAAILKRWELEVEVGEHALDQWGFMAGRDEDRLSDLNDAFRDPGVRAVIAAMGGAGAYRIADGIDFDAVRADPKPVLGFSDITSLHLALWQRCRLANVHGCLTGERAEASARQLLMTTRSITLHRDPGAASAAIDIPGRATGFLMGGNLTQVQGFIGAGMPSLDGAILCLEDHGTAADAAVLDRILHHLLDSGSLAGLHGVAIGDLGGLDDSNAEAAPGRKSTVEVYLERLGALGIPVLGGLPFGHLPDQSCVPLGPTATLDTAAGTLTVAPAVV